MPILSSDLLLYATTNVPSSDTGTLGGAIDLTNEIADDDFNKIITTLLADIAGGSTRYRYGKTHYYNNHASIDLTDAKIYIPNLLDNPATAGVITFASSSASDNSSFLIRMYYEDGTGWATEDIAMNGTSFVSSSASPLALQPIRVDFRTSAGVLTTCNGNISVYRGATLLGIIPAGFSSATGEVEIFVATSLDDTVTTTDRTTAPGGASWSKPKTYDTGSAVANSGTLTFGTNQAIWYKFTITDGSYPHDEMQIITRIGGKTT